MKQIINGIRGTVRLELTGAFPERFLNLCAVENLPFWDAEQTDAHTLRVTLALPDRRRAEGLAERGMCRTREGWTVLLRTEDAGEAGAREASLEEIMIHLEKEAEEA